MQYFAFAFLLSLFTAGFGMLSTPAAAQSVPMGAALDWWKLEPEMVVFLCLPERKPAWCADSAAGIRPPEPLPPPPPPEPRGRRSRSDPPPPPPPPPKSVDDESWQHLLGDLERRRPLPEDIVTLERRGFEDRDPAALEMLGLTYATGRGRPADLALAYQYYGLAAIKGAADARAKLDDLWRGLGPDHQQYIRFRFERAFPRP